MATPAGLAIFGLRQNGILVSEDGVPASTQGSAFRVYVEASGTPGQPRAVRSGLALTNTSGAAAAVSLELMALDGTATGSTPSIPVPASGLFFPQFVDSGGWTTQFILYSGTPGQTSAGSL